MKTLSDDFPELAFVDIETTGSNFERDRITEVGIVTLHKGEIDVWEQLINPETCIPSNIQALTGIRPDMVANAPNFEEISRALSKKLEGKIFVAHNARFDYGFLKASFKRVGIDFKPKVLCTVKLSRKLFPNQVRHNLDTLIQAHQLKVSSRHRALGDADLLLQFWNCCISKLGSEELYAAAQSLLGNSSLPSHIDPDLMNLLPEKPGVYIFYGENKMPIYIGKSISIRTRVLSHFQSALSKRKEMNLAMQVRDIDWIETAGEIGALLLESKLIKQRLPTLNVKLRRSKDLCAWQLTTNSAGVLIPELVTHHQLKPGRQDNLFGLFYSRREAKIMLSSIAERNHLCLGLLGLEKLTKDQPCFGYQVKKCQGACIAKESYELHNIKLTTVLEKFKVAHWTFKGPIGIQEGNVVHIIDHWCYLGTAMNEEEIAELLESGEPEFDLDIYKLIQKSLRTITKSRVFELTSKLHQRQAELG
ncbi:exonuclease domain-containing protein [Polynucleobacter brandtiae]|uniref:Excinuclease cho n=1 Tax=Polynucleobacter brandtiae TaxID=1938816 RepID=A0A2M8VZR0_9BURK|nr:exonuclease domain-containing protein [Polynucleobacter brandtiae]PJI83340.1 DNA polymerase-3 subunit epsilon [Polynucleobacter brandtiae]